MKQKKSFLFLCDLATEPECLSKQLVGTNPANAIWAVTVEPSDEIYLFNFETGVIYGPYLALSGADCHDPTAWGGRFRVQVKISKSSFTRKSDIHSLDTPSVLKKRRPTGDLGLAAEELFSWIQRSGIPVE